MAGFAAKHGHLELVKWLCGEEGLAMNEEVMANAAQCRGNLEMVQWLRGEGCPWDKETSEWAVISFDLEMLRWVRENGCEWTAETRDEAYDYFKYADDFGNLVE